MNVKGHMGSLGFDTINIKTPKSCVSVLMAALCDMWREWCKTKAHLSDLLVVLVQKECLDGTETP